MKNINIETNGNHTTKIYCDMNWQIEAITNILKNCVEHSKNNSKIETNNGYISVESELGKGTKFIIKYFK